MSVLSLNAATMRGSNENTWGWCGVGDRVGPYLRDVTARREQSWLSAFIQNPAKLRALRDPAAMALAEKYPAVRMPVLGLGQQDAADLVSYLAAEALRLREEQAPMPVKHQHDGHAHHH